MRRAVILFNLGGPDSLDAVRPFLFNLFNDPAIIRLPQPLRWTVAQLISRSRDKTARAIYRRLGGKSPLLDETRAQAVALEIALNRDADELTRVFIAMRYWHPLTEETVAEVKAFAPDAVALVPLYPQFSTTTTASSRAAWERAAAAVGLTATTGEVRSYPDHPAFVEAQADLLRRHLQKAGGAPVRVLFSAHGLPQKIVDAGDPYPLEVALSAKTIARAAGLTPADWRVCYQSRVGRLKWLEPSIEEELARAAQDGLGVVILPVAFVSEHSETLVELDIDYYIRVPALGTHATFIAGLADLARRAFAQQRSP